MNDRPNPDRVQRRAADPNVSVWVSASAGSGKTKVLTDRVLALLVSGAKPDALLCVTFTKAAATEMANRIHGRLAAWTRLSDPELDAEVRILDGGPVTGEKRGRARRLFAEVLDLPGGLRISTIHSFCQSVLGRFPLEAGLSPDFTAMDDREAADAMALARDTVLSAAATGSGPLADALSLVTTRAQEGDFAQLLEGLSANRGGVRAALSRFGGIDGAVAELYRRLDANLGFDETEIIAEACCGADEIGLRRAAAVLRDHGGKGNAARWPVIDAWLAGGQGTRAATFDRYFGTLITKDGRPNGKIVVKAIRENSPAIADVIAAEQERLLAVDARLRRQVTARSSEGLLRLGDAILRAYEQRKRASATLDYDDLIQKTAALLIGDRVPWVLFKLDGGLDHLLVDEAQDTSPPQRAILDALVAEFFAGDTGRDARRTLFVVGDAKQSIFSFQGADPGGYGAWREALAARAGGAGGEGLRLVETQVSFRSVQAVLDAVDRTFAEPPACVGVTDPGALRHFASARKQGLRGRVELWPPTVPPERAEADLFLPPSDATKAAEANATQILAEGLAETVAGWIGRDPLPAEGRTVRAGDILFLVRSRTGLIDILVRELNRRNVPVAGVDRLTLADEIAVMDLLALARALLLPQDDLTLACVLKSPFVGFGDDEIYRLASQRGRGVSLWRRLRAMRGNDPRFAAAADWMARLLAEADRLPPYELFHHALVMPCPGPGLGAQGVHSGRQALSARLGREIDDPLDEFLNQALDYDRRFIPSLEGFMAWFAGDNTDLKRDLEAQARDEVRIMTAHGAKGLQAPIVILPDALRKPSGRGVQLCWIEAGDRSWSLPLWTPGVRFEEPVAAALKARRNKADDEEFRRLLYVAMTRAESRLIVTGRMPRGGLPKGTWYQLVQAGFDRLDGVREEDFRPIPSWTGIAKVFETGDREAVAGAAAPTADTAAPPEAPAWLSEAPPPEPVLPQPLTPSRPEAPDPPARSPLDPGDGLRFRRGRLIHRLLQTLPDLPPDAREAAARRFLALPGHQLSDTQQAALAAEVFGVLNHAEFAPLFGPDSRAEVPLAGLLTDRRMATDGKSGGARAVSGQVDRLLIGTREILVVDYKTLRPAPSDPAEVPRAYLSQMAGYRGILRQIFPGRAVRCALVFTETPRLVALPSGQMDAHA